MDEEEDEDDDDAQTQFRYSKMIPDDILPKIWGNIYVKHFITCKPKIHNELLACRHEH